MATIDPTADGLITSRPDITTAEEVSAFRDYYRRHKGSIAAWELLLEHRPDVLKRHRHAVRVRTRDENAAFPLSHILSYLHQYTIVRFAEGVQYELRMAQAAGAGRSDVLDTLAVAFLHAGAPGLTAVAQLSSELLANWPESNQPSGYPPGWTYDATAFDSGMDWSSASASPDDMARLEQWYLATLGEVPAYARFLMRHRPSELKAYRNAFEHAIMTSLPKQMMAYLLLHHNVHRGSPGGIREAVLLGRAFGMTVDQLLDAICWGAFQGGINSLQIVEEAAGDVLDQLA